MERGLHEYGRQMQESQQKLKRSRSRNNRNYRAYKLQPSASNFNSITPLNVPSQNHGLPSTLTLPNTMEPSISAPTNYNLDKAHSIPGQHPFYYLFLCIAFQHFSLVDFLCVKWTNFNLWHLIYGQI